MLDNFSGGGTVKEALIFIHGASHSEDGTIGFMRGLEKNLKKYYDTTNDDTFQFDWSHLIHSEQYLIHDRRFKKPKWFEFRKKIRYELRRNFIFGIAMDSTLYGSKRGELIKSFNDFLFKIKIFNYKKVKIVAWSMGGLIAYETLNKFVNTWYNDSNFMELPTIKLITFGCNIPLNIGDNFECPKFISWYNIFEKDDFLAMPLMKELIKDIELKSSHPFLSWNPMAHISYFNDKKFFRIVANILRSF